MPLAPARGGGGHSVVDGVHRLKERIWTELAPSADEIADFVSASHARAGLTRGYDRQATAFIRHGNRLHMRWGIAGFAGDPGACDSLRQLWQETVHYHATRGAPEDVVLSAYVLGTRHLWSALCDRLSASVDTAAVQDVVARQLWRSLNAQTRAIRSGYRASAGTAASRDQVASLLDSLVDGSADDAYAAARASGLNISTQARVVCVAGLIEPQARTAPLADPATVLADHGLTSAWHTRARVLFGVIALAPDDPDEDALLGLLRPCVRGRVGLATSPTGLAGLAAAYRHAVHTASLLRPGEERIEPFARWLPETLLRGNRELAETLIRTTLGPVLALPRRLAEPLLETLGVLVRAKGSVAEQAARLGVHRNTLLHRRHRLEQLTGRSFIDADDLLVLGLAARSLEIWGQG